VSFPFPQKLLWLRPKAHQNPVAQPDSNLRVPGRLFGVVDRTQMPSNGPAPDASSYEYTTKPFFALLCHSSLEMARRDFLINDTPAAARFHRDVHGFYARCFCPSNFTQLKPSQPNQQPLHRYL
jgi:hypothetical protein